MAGVRDGDVPHGCERELLLRLHPLPRPGRSNGTERAVLDAQPARTARTRDGAHERRDLQARVQERPGLREPRLDHPHGETACCDAPSRRSDRESRRCHPRAARSWSRPGSRTGPARRRRRPRYVVRRAPAPPRRGARGGDRLRRRQPLGTGRAGRPGRRAARCRGGVRRRPRRRTGCHWSAHRRRPPRAQRGSRSRADRCDQDVEVRQRDGQVAGLQRAGRTGRSSAAPPATPARARHRSPRADAQFLEIGEASYTLRLSRLPT